MRSSITRKIIFNAVAPVALAVFISGSFLIRIYRNILKDNGIDQELVNTIVKNSAGAFTLIMILLVLILILVIYSNLRIVVINSLKKLQEGSNMLGNRKFDYRIELDSDDEFEEVADSFNAMASELQDMYENMDEKVARLTVKNKEDAEKLKERNIFLENMRKATLNILADISESEQNLRKKTEELQKANEIIDQQKDRAESILNFLKSIGDGVVATDMDGRIIFVNEAAERLLNVSNNVYGKKAGDVLEIFREKNAETRYDIIQEVLECKGKICITKDHFFVKNSDGSHTVLSFSTSFIYDTNKIEQGCILVMRDVTEERKLDEAKDNFLSIAAHQLRTPLSGIRWNLEMLLGDDVGKLPKEAHEVVEDINSNTLRLISLVNDLLNVSRINTGKSMDSPAPVAVVENIMKALRNMNGFADKNKVKIIFDEKKNSDLKVMMIPRRFLESVGNIISNAIKYSPAGGNVKISVSEKDGNVEIAVADSGIGIPKKDQEKIFSKFFRSANATIKDPDGSGLGLNVVKSFIEEAGGIVSFESEEGKGTIFFASLPIYRGGE